jgi:hypothetical protein
MTEVQVSRWRKYGKDRLYVNGADGVRIGWLDNVSGERVIERPEFAAAFEAALAKEGAPATGVLRAPATQLAAPPRPPRPSEQMWVDLAPNQPGQGIRALAVAERQEMRDRSKLRTFIATARDEKTPERAWRVGADGEEAVGHELRGIERYGWRLLHSVAVGTGTCDIDHVVIGPGGVYTLNTKNHRGHRITVYEYAILVDGHTQSDYLRNSRHEAERAGRLLTRACGFAVDVASLIVVLGDKLTVKKQPADVQVVGRLDITLWLRKRPPVLSAAEVDAIWEQARRSTTWQLPTRSALT